jgi:hypothetical protein
VPNYAAIKTDCCQFVIGRNPPVRARRIPQARAGAQQGRCGL